MQVVDLIHDQVEFKLGGLADSILLEEHFLVGQKRELTLFPVGQVHQQRVAVLLFHLEFVVPLFDGGQLELGILSEQLIFMLRYFVCRLVEIDFRHDQCIYHYFFCEYL